MGANGIIALPVPLVVRRHALGVSFPWIPARLRELFNGRTTGGLVERDECDVSLSRICPSPKGFQVFAAEARQHNIEFLRGCFEGFDWRFGGGHDLSGFDAEPILEGFDIDVTMAPTDVPLGLVVRTIEQHV